jgi:hypothetical protein
LKFSFLISAALLLTSHQALAACNTVMGGCTTEETVNVAPHMRSENNKPAVNNAPQSNNQKAVAADKNLKNAAANNSQANKTTTKKM